MTAKVSCCVRMVVLPAHTPQVQRGTHHRQRVDIGSVAGVGEAGEVCSPAEPCSVMAGWQLQQKELDWHWGSRYMGWVFGKSIAGLVAGRLGSGRGMPWGYSLLTTGQRRLAGMAD